MWIQFTTLMDWNEMCQAASKMIPGSFSAIPDLFGNLKSMDGLSGPGRFKVNVTSVRVLQWLQRVNGPVDPMRAPPEAMVKFVEEGGVFSEGVFMTGPRTAIVLWSAPMYTLKQFSPMTTCLRGPCRIFQRLISIVCIFIRISQRCYFRSLYDHHLRVRNHRLKS